MRFRKGEGPLDPWSFVHFASGVALGFVVSSWFLGLGALIAYEFFEGALRRVKHKGGGLFEHESWANIVADLALGFLGFAIIRVAHLPTILPW